MQKTIKQWLEELPEPYRSKALKNHAEKPIEYLADTKTSDLGGAIANAFAWGGTAEGYDYWRECCTGNYPGAEEPRTLVVLDQDKLPEPPIPELKSTVPTADEFVLDWPKPGPVAKIACPELDRELVENPPSGETWISALLEPLRSKFAEAYEAYKTKFADAHAAYFDSFGYLVDVLNKTGFLPTSYATHPHHVFCSHNPRYLTGANIMDELGLASIIGTSPERAAVLNGQYYNSGQSVTFTEKHQEPFLQVEGQIMAEGVLKHLSEGLTQHEAIEADALDRVWEKVQAELRDGTSYTAGLIPKPTPDPVNHPSHYTKGDVECIDALAAATIDLTGMEAVCTANAIKYLWRWKHKNGVEDLKKAKFYIDKLIIELEK